MSVQLTPQQSKSVQALMQSGAYRDEAQVIDEALSLLTKHEELRACVNAGVRQLDQGQYRTYQPNERERFMRDIDKASQERGTQMRGESR
jgi:Arc/MetJ-type ribon-helix-helix transcriptional regulator